MNLWHDIPLGDKAPEEFNTIIEIPKGSPNKYEVDKKTGLIKLDRANYSNAPYPFDYGFAPQTYWDDKDPLDVIVLTTFPLVSGILVNVRPVAVIEMIDDGDSDYKIIAVPVKDPRWENVKEFMSLARRYDELEPSRRYVKLLEDIALITGAKFFDRRFPSEIKDAESIAKLELQEFLRYSHMQFLIKH